MITHADVTVKELHIPSTDGESFSPHTVTRPWKYHALLLSLSTFIRANAKSLTVYDNAIILISDTEDFRLNINVSVRLTKTVFSLLGLVISKRTRKGAGLTTHVGK